MSAYLFTLLAASMLLLEKLEVELFLLLLVELLELLLQKRQEVHIRVTRQWPQREFYTLRNVLFNPLRYEEGTSSSKHACLL